MTKMFIALLMAYVIYFIHMIVHEFGHLVFGLATGYQFSSIRILKFMWQKDDDGKIRYYNYNIAGTGGQCLMTPPEYDAEGKNPYILYNAGGIMLNLLLAIIFGICYLCLKDISNITRLIFLIFVDIGFFTALINGLSLNGLENDGRNIYLLSKSSAAIRSFYIQMRGVILLKKGIRVKDFPEEWFVIPSDDELKNYICAVLAVYVCDRLFDKGDYEQAAATIEVLLNKDVAFADAHRQLLKNNVAFCAILKRDKSKADLYLDDELKKFMKVMQSHPSIIRTQYAYELLINEDADKAAEKMELFDKVASSYPYQVEIAAEREAMMYAAKLHV